MPNATGDQLAEGRALLAQSAWREARVCFEAALAERESPEAHEGLSWAAWWLNDGTSVIRAREAAYKLYRRRADEVGAARMAMWVGCDYADFRGEIPIARGWLSRARRLLEPVPITAEHGWLYILEAEAAAYFDEDVQESRRLAERATAVGRSVGVPDLETVGLALEGLSLVGEGQAVEGMRRLDEAAAAVVGGDFRDRIWATKVLCYLVYACARVRDFGRAAQWCDKMRALADRMEFTFAQGLCRTHYASVLISRGQWGEAEAQLADAMSMLRRSRPACAVEGVVRLAELRRRQGRLEEAALSFREAEWHPAALLGLAEIALDAGRPADADDLLDRLLRQLPESSRLQRAAALELRVRVDALLGRHQRAADALQIVRALANSVATLPLRGSASFSAGLLAIAAREFDRGRAHLEDAVDLFERSCTPYEAARARLELAAVLVVLDRLDRARAVAVEARTAFEELGSVFFTRRATALLESIDGRLTAASGDASSPLTRRQTEILQLVSRGMNDHAIAKTLGLSEHTVHRHVANILLRLNAPNRAAAAAHATSRGLIAAHAMAKTGHARRS